MKMSSFWLKIQKNSVIKGDSYSQLFKGTYIEKKNQMWPRIEKNSLRT